MDTEIVRPVSREIGTPEYVKTVVSLAARWAKHINQDCRPFVEQCHKLINCRGWEAFFSEGEKSWERLCTEAIKLPSAFVTKIVEGVQFLEGVSYQGPIPAQLAEEMTGKIVNAGPGPLTKEERSNDDIVINRSTGLGNSATYLTARIARDRPDILERMKAGDYKSVRAAAKEAGIVKDKTPLQHVQTGWKHATLNDKRLIVGWIQDRHQEDQEIQKDIGMSHKDWTKSTPTEAGYYWYRFDPAVIGNLSEPLTCDNGYPWLADIFDDHGVLRVAIDDLWESSPTAEEATQEGYWSSRLVPPQIKEGETHG